MLSDSLLFAVQAVGVANTLNRITLRMCAWAVLIFKMDLSNCINISENGRGKVVFYGGVKKNYASIQLEHPT